MPKLLTVRITSRPPGGAPDKVRDAWVGLDMPATPNNAELADISTLAKTHRSGGYAVQWDDAMKALTGKAEALQWWMQYEGIFSVLVFSSECCKVVSTADR